MIPEKPGRSPGCGSGANKAQKRRMDLPRAVQEGREGARKSHPAPSQRSSCSRQLEHPIGLTRLCPFWLPWEEIPARSRPWLHARLPGAELG